MPSRARKKQTAYAAAGVNLDLGNQVKRGIGELVASTHGPEVLSGIGGFGGLFRADFGRGMREPVLVSSIDGVGTKLKVAFAVGRHDTVGQDLVNHCVNDIAVTGARPLFFLDYLGAARLEPDVFRQLIKGFAAACREAGCALIGGETAQMPGMYKPGEYDVAGCIVGVVDRRRLIDGSRIRSGDVILGLPSNGLHTNGYSLARRVFFDRMGLRPDSRVRGLRGSLGSELLRIHRNYQPVLGRLRPGVLRGAAHITGGGLVDNLPRILPEGMSARIDRSSWKVPAIFRILQEHGSIGEHEMPRVFNMGIGMALVVSRDAAAGAAEVTGGIRIGVIEPGGGTVEFHGEPR